MENITNTLDNGVRIIKSWHIVLLFVIMILTGGMIYGVSQFRLELVEQKVKENENWKETYIKEQQQIQGQMLEKLNKIQIDQALIKYKLGIKENEKFNNENN